MKRLKVAGFIQRTPDREYWLSTKGRLEADRIRVSNLVANKDILLCSTIPPSCNIGIHATAGDIISARNFDRAHGIEPEPDASDELEWMPPLGPVNITLYGSKELRRSLGYALDDWIVPEREASRLVNARWMSLGRDVRQIVFSLVIDYLLDLARSNGQLDFNKPIQMGMNIRLDINIDLQVRHRIAGLLLWYMALPDDPAYPQYPMEVVSFLEKKLGMLTSEESKTLRKLIEEEGYLERQCLELSLKHFREGGCLSNQEASAPNIERISPQRD